MTTKYLFAWGFYAAVVAVWGAVIAIQRAKTKAPDIMPEYTPVAVYGILGAVGLCCAAMLGV